MDAMEGGAPDGGAADGDAAVTARMRQWARRSAADYLGKHSSSAENLRRVMLRRAERRHPGIGERGAQTLAAEAVAFCREHAFVDDTSYAAMKVRSGVRKGHSRRRIALTLGLKGVDRETAGEALAGADDLAAAAALARRRRIGPWRKTPLDADGRRREAASFGRNGFSGDTAAAVMAMTLEEAEAAIDERERAG
jgi:regulatory protein